MPVPSDLLGAETHSPLNGCPLVALGPDDPVPPAGVCVLVDRAGNLPGVDPAPFDVLLTTCLEAPAPWVSVPAERLDDRLATIRATATQSPLAAAMLARVLRLGEGLDFEAALDVESLAYSVLLGGGEFARWLDKAPCEPSGAQAAAPVRYAREADHVTLTLASPGDHNAMTAAMRDALYEVLVNVLEDPSLPCVTLRAEGRCFSTGGDLAEFGSARDLAAAHVIRTQRSCARLLHRLGSRATVLLHGACIGSGIEVPAAAGRRIGASDLIVQLPELTMGLIPGAGGTVSIARAIGRHRLTWLALGAFRIGARQALDWGLIHEIAQ